MKKRILTLLAAVCLLSAVLTGCGGGSTEETPEDRAAANAIAEALEEAGEAARAALAGENGVMVGLRRVPGPVYQVETFLIPVEQVMLYERKMPDEYISADGCDVTDAFVEWCRPLIGSPLRQFITFKPTL